MTKLIALVLVLVMVLGLTACGGDDGKYTIGICQLITHDALGCCHPGL